MSAGEPLWSGLTRKAASFQVLVGLRDVLRSNVAAREAANGDDDGPVRPSQAPGKPGPGSFGQGIRKRPLIRRAGTR